MENKGHGKPEKNMRKRENIGKQAGENRGNHRKARENLGKHAKTEENIGKQGKT